MYYVFVLMSEHSLAHAAFGWFWTGTCCPCSASPAAPSAGARRMPPVLLAGCAALAVEGYAALVHSGGRVNDMLPAYLAVALLAGLADGGGSGRAGGLRDGGLARVRIAGWPAGGSAGGSLPGPPPWSSRSWPCW